ncbi:hypothetical protein ROP_72250 [Rhodococcus opacus B4]|uniref:DUF3263 domain-containing protein n=2 Tax=Rhodococcus opacus TaxID=37919 RepID=C1B661_RHOOB|nr:hypothetical protein ROP_72250 [Rhodococcus opacus B4]
MLGYVIAWAPFGGGDEEILPQFGITPDNFYLRLARILESRSCGGIDFATRNRLREFCAGKLSSFPPNPDRASSIDVRVD